MAQNAPSQPLRNTGGSICRGFSVGEAFDPFHKVCGFYPPDVVGRQRDFTEGQSGATKPFLGAESALGGAGVAFGQAGPDITITAAPA